jgi:hypothetical protein
MKSALRPAVLDVGAFLPAADHLTCLNRTALLQPRARWAHCRCWATGELIIQIAASVEEAAPSTPTGASRMPDPPVAECQQTGCPGVGIPAQRFHLDERHPDLEPAYDRQPCRTCRDRRRRTASMRQLERLVLSDCINRTACTPVRWAFAEVVP